MNSYIYDTTNDEWHQVQGQDKCSIQPKVASTVCIKRSDFIIVPMVVEELNKSCTTLYSLQSMEWISLREDKRLPVINGQLVK